MTDLTFPADHRPLGASGIDVSPLAWGMWRFRGGDVNAAARLVNAALDAGITLLDTADIYGPDNNEPFGAAEELLGQVLAADPSRRERMVLASKGGIRMGVPYDSSAAYIAEAIDASLRRLQTEQLDLWQIHRPDMLAHPQEVARALDDAVEAGKVRALGVSNMTVAQIAALNRFLDQRIVSVQPEFSPLATDPLFNGLLDTCMAEDLAVLAWSPLGQGRLGGDGAGDARAATVIALLDAKAAEAGVPRAAVAYAWIGAHPARPIPIVGTQTPERIAEAALAHRVSFTRAEWYAILQAGMGAKLP